MRLAERVPRSERLVVARLVVAAAALVLLFAVPAICATAGGIEPLSAFPQRVLAVRTSGGRVIDIRAWIADTPRRAEQGLMFVRRLDPHDGMLFPFAAGRPVVMWMKNTYLSLDMAFIDAQGRITAITKRAQPLSLDLIYAPMGTRAVLELGGGICDRFGIRIGDRVLGTPRS